MRRSLGATLLAIELGILSGWLLSVRFETGIDALQYQRMANAVVRYGVAPWIVHPLSYLGIYPGSDSSGIPFIVGPLSMVTGLPVAATVLVYDALLIVIFGLGLFMLTAQFTERADVALLAVLLGTLAFGFLTTLLWSLDERSFNVALAPLFLYLCLPRGVQSNMRRPIPRFFLITLMGSLMLVAHLNFLLLLPFPVITPLLYEVLRRQHAVRRKRRASVLYFGMIALSPLLLLMVLDQLGALAEFRLQYQLESSALFSGNSSVIFLANALVFIGTRVGPVNLVCSVLGLSYLASRPYLFPRSVVFGGVLLTGFLGLPVVVYSKDLLVPIFAVLGALGVGSILTKPMKHRVVVVALSVFILISGSAAFDAWNYNRSYKSAETRYWSTPAVTPETQNANLWMRIEPLEHDCAYGNNAVLLQQVTSEPAIGFCTGLSVDFLINLGPSALRNPPPFQVIFKGATAPNPNDWFFSPEFAEVAKDFAQLPGLHYDAGRLLLLKYNVSKIIVHLAKPFDIPLFEYQGSARSIFFSELWANSYPIYRSGMIAIFGVE
jgi:hypothetical protein